MKISQELEDYYFSNRQKLDSGWQDHLEENEIYLKDDVISFTESMFWGYVQGELNKKLRIVLLLSLG